MSTTDAARDALYARLEGVLGAEHAETLMAYLPGQPAAEAVTSRDLALLGDRLERRFEQIDERFSQIDQRFEQIDRRLEHIDERFERIDQHLEHIDERFHHMHQRMERLEDRFERLEDRVDHRLERLDIEVHQMQRFYVGTTVGAMTALTAIFSFVVSLLV